MWPSTEEVAAVTEAVVAAAATASQYVRFYAAIVEEEQHGESHKRDAPADARNSATSFRPAISSKVKPNASTSAAK